LRRPLGNCGEQFLGPRRHCIHRVVEQEGPFLPALDVFPTLAHDIGLKTKNQPVISTKGFRRKPVAILVEQFRRAGELAAQADRRLAHYPDYVRPQVTELLRILAGEREAAENGVP
jgi:hypothetical protein